MKLPPDIPAEVVPFLREMGYLEPDALQTGDAVPPIALPVPKESRSVLVGDPNALKPVALIFGSYT